MLRWTACNYDSWPNQLLEWLLLLNCKQCWTVLGMDWVSNDNNVLFFIMIILRLHNSVLQDLVITTRPIVWAINGHFRDNTIVNTMSRYTEAVLSSLVLSLRNSLLSCCSSLFLTSCFTIVTVTLHTLKYDCVYTHTAGHNLCAPITWHM